MCKTKTYSDSKQTMWETWFVLSIVILASYIIVGTMEGSVDMFPNWSIFAGIALFNFIVCLHIGCRKED